MSYSGDPSASSKDAIRFFLGDTSPPFHWTDAEIAFMERKYPSQEEVIRHLLVQKIKAYSLQPKVRIGKFEVDPKPVVDNMKQLLMEIEDSSASFAPWAGGISKDDKRANRENPDLVQPRFWRDQMTNWRGNSDESPEY